MVPAPLTPSPASRRGRSAQQVQPGVPLPHPLPQVGGAVAVGVRRVALAAVVAPVERQEARRGALEARRHRDLLGVHGEVDDRPAPRVTFFGSRFVAVLLLGVLDALPREGVLQLSRGDGDAVDEERQVQGLVRAWLVRELPGHGEPVRLVRSTSSGVSPWAGLK